MKIFKSKAFYSGLVALLGVMLIAVSIPATAKPLNTKKGVAVKGYDVVAYFDLEEGAPAVKGDSEISSTHGEGTYYFSSQANKEKFDAEPEAFVPEYGGYCAYAFAKGKKVGIDPNAWAIRDGKLYLNYNKSVQSDWVAKADEFISQADAEWKKLP